MPKYQVIKKAFVNGSLHEPGEIIEAPPGMAGAGLKLVSDDPSIALPVADAPAPAAPAAAPAAPQPVVAGPDPNTPPPSQEGKGKK